MVVLPTNRSPTNRLNKSRTQTRRQYDQSSRRITLPFWLCDFPPRAWRLCSRYRL